MEVGRRSFPFPRDPGSPYLRMVSWNLNTLLFGGDFTPQSSSDKVIGSLGFWNGHFFRGHLFIFRGVEKTKCIQLQFETWKTRKPLISSTLLMCTRVRNSSFSEIVEVRQKGAWHNVHLPIPENQHKHMIMCFPEYHQKITQKSPRKIRSFVFRGIIFSFFLLRIHMDSANEKSPTLWRLHPHPLSPPQVDAELPRPLLKYNWSEDLRMALEFFPYSSSHTSWGLVFGWYVYRV